MWDGSEGTQVICELIVAASGFNPIRLAPGNGKNFELARELTNNLSETIELASIAATWPSVTINHTWSKQFGRQRVGAHLF